MKQDRLTALSRARGHLRRSVAAYAVLLGALLLTGLAWYYVSRTVAAEERLRFEQAVQSTQRAVDRRMDTYIAAMLDGRGLFAASETVTREEWGDYVTGSELERRYPGIRAIGYAGRVSPEEREDHVQEVRGEGFPGYEVRPSGERYEYFPLVYIAPFEGTNERLLGYDVYSDPVSRAAMEQARDSGLPKASGKVDLFFEDGSSRRGFLVFTPVYREGAPHADAVDRRRALQGFIVSVFAAEELLEGIFGAQANPEIDLEVFDGAEFTPEHLLHDDDGVVHAGDESYSPDFSKITTLEVAGRIWTLYFSTLPGFEHGSRRNLPLFVLLSGLAASLLLFAVTQALTRSRTHAERVGAQLETANKELEATNRELEAFSYSVSHDLRAPLRSINGFSQILLEDYGENLDDEARDYLRRVRAASEHMGDLIDDLLTLSRVTRTEMRRQSVDLSALAREVAAELREGDPTRDVELAIADVPQATGDARLLRIALENLLGNAFKFTGKQEEARIEFGAEHGSSDGAPTYYFVRDNGAGFDMAYAGKLFGAFQRLHKADDFEGTGIGLATVQRVIRRHAGEVWAEGEVGKGATFYFTLEPRERGRG